MPKITTNSDEPMLVSALNLLRIRWLPALLLFPLFIFTVFLLKTLFPSPKPPKNRPPSPPKLPIIGNLLQLGPNPHRVFQSLSLKYGPLMLLHLGNVPLLVISSADLSRQVFKTHDSIFSDRPNSVVLSWLYGRKDIAFASYGEYWRQVKSMCVHELLSTKKVQSFRYVREVEIGLMVDEIRTLCDGNFVINLGEMFASLTKDVICRVVLGKKYGGRKFKEVLETLGVLLGSFNVGEFIPWLVWINCVNGMNGKLRRVAKDLDEFLELVVKEHLEEKRERVDGEKEKDFVDVLLEIQRNGELGEGGFELDAGSVKALILDMFAAGTDTTFTLMEWTFSELIKHDNVMKKLKKELQNIAGQKTSITEDDLDKCQYLKAVIKETLRLHPPLPLLVPRETTQDVNLLNYDIAARTRVVINVWAIGRDPLMWEDPLEFLPERFLNNSSVDFKGGFQFIPFGAGRRGCPGGAFALGIAELALANLVLNFDFALPGGMRGEDLDMSEGEGITIHKKYPLLVIACQGSTLDV